MGVLEVFNRFPFEPDPGSLEEGYQEVNLRAAPLHGISVANLDEKKFGFQLNYGSGNMK
ncbi:MAG: hypothetical protein HY787_05770 [Deltaproteobacteria bacterium]|nr:hypothetical protein [Deltaproteobacteria bacterium]